METWLLKVYCILQECDHVSLPVCVKVLGSYSRDKNSLIRWLRSDLISNQSPTFWVEIQLFCEGLRSLLENFDLKKRYKDKRAQQTGQAESRAVLENKTQSFEQLVLQGSSHHLQTSQIRAVSKLSVLHSKFEVFMEEKQMRYKDQIRSNWKHIIHTKKSCVGGKLNTARHPEQAIRKGFLSCH